MYYTGCFKKSFTTLKAYRNIQYHVHERDFFLRGFVKDRVFVPPLPANVVELRTRITAAVAKVTPEMLRSMWQETDYRWDVCRITNGSHIEPYLSEVKLGVFCYILTVQNFVYVLCINFYTLSKL